MGFGSNEFRIEVWKTKCKAQAAETEIIKISPDGRYLQYDEVLGRGAFKIVYKGFDEIDGIEIAWSQVRIEDVLQSPEHLERLYSEIHLLRSLNHENIIRSHASWVDDGNRTINMITELFTSGSLREYRKKHKYVDIKAIKNWARQILQGLDYMHTHNPRIIHRDLKCDNIFMNGNYGEVKIGDLGLATIMQQPTARSVIGTPEFMAPELYEEEYNELVDIYSFGMCILEMVTCEYPYSECKNQAQIYKKVTSGIKPAALGKIQDPEVRLFIEKCLVPASERLSAAELLKDSFLMSEHPKTYNRVHPQLSEFTSNSVNSTKSQCSFVDIDRSCKLLSGSSFAGSMVENSVSVLELHRSNERTDFALKGEKYDDDSISLTLRIAGHSGDMRNVHFLFYLNTDTALSIAEEMVEHLDLWKDDVDLIADLINGLISQLIRSWRVSSGSLNGTELHGGSIALQNENFLANDVSNHNSDGIHDQEHNQIGISSELIDLKDDGVTKLRGASPQHKDAPILDAMHKEDLQFDDGGKISTRQSVSISVKNSETSFVGSWTTASSEMNVSFSSLSPDKENEASDDLKVELEAIDMQYRRCCHELLEMRETAILNAKKKWIMKKMSVL